MQVKHAYSESLPPQFKVVPLPHGYDIQVAENVSAAVLTDESEEGKTVKKDGYKFDLYNAVINADDYGSFIAGVTHLKYSVDDEIALINKGIADSSNAEYVEYREFVTAVKAEAVKWFSKE